MYCVSRVTSTCFSIVFFIRHNKFFTDLAQRSSLLCHQRLAKQHLILQAQKSTELPKLKDMAE